MTLRALRYLVCLCLLEVPLASACGGGLGSYEPQRGFDQQLAVVSPHDEPGGRFDGARLSPGFGILYINGYTNETADSPGCGGYFAGTPEHVFEVSYTMYLKVVVQSHDDLVLGIRNPDGSLVCWEEDSASNENVSLAQTYYPGDYRVWVGPRVPATSSAYRLVLSE